MELKDFIKDILLKDNFKLEYIDELLAGDKITQPEDYDHYLVDKSRSNWKIRIKGKLGFKSFASHSRNYWIFRGFNYLEARDLAKSKVGKRKGISPMKPEFWVEKGLSEEEAQRKVNSFRKLNTEYWEDRGFTTDEAKEKIREFQIENSKKLLISQKEKPLLHEGINWTQKLYWIKKGLSEEEAIQHVSKLQNTFSLEKCIQRYGEEEGTKVWTERQLKWAKSYKKTNFSKASQDLFWMIIESGQIDKSQTIYFATYEMGEKMEDGKNREYPLKVGSYVMKPDFIILEKKKIIEFDGTYWHNFKKRDKPENKKREVERDKKLTEAGYQILRVLENDFYKKKKETVQRCIDFINS